MKFSLLIKSVTETKKPLLAVLIDPDKFNLDLIKLCNQRFVFCFLVGGSILEKGNIKTTVLAIKKHSNIPIILFPGDETQLTKEADGLFLPSLISGTNPDYLITKQLLMAPLIKKMKLESAPMAYLLINNTCISSIQKITKTKPLNPKNKKEIINTAITAELLGFKLIYLEAGSGSTNPISSALVKQIKLKTSLPILVGGGIDSINKAKQAISSGANIIVVGNALEKNISLLNKISLLF